MDSFEAAKVVHERILEYEPDPIASKIVGYVYLQECPDQEMIRLALGPDSLIQTLVKKAKVALQLAPISPVSRVVNQITIPDPSVQYLRFASTSSRVRAIPPRLVAARCWDSLVTEQHHMGNSDFESLKNYDSLPEDYRFQNRFMSLDDRIEPMNSGASGFGDYCFNEATFNNLSLRQSPLDVPVKICHYFNKGFCKHGSNCRYLHGQAFSDNYSQGFGRNSNEFGNDDQLFSPGSLAKLEKEITDLLKSRGGNPVSIASLPLLYSETYGRELEGEGYLRESQRHGKAGYSLTKLLARLKNSIRLIERPHGQHVVILAEDAPNYLVSRGERNDPGPIVSNSRQIYLTFPAESTFTEEDVSNHFSTFGAVHDVRIPCQQKRMFGFVTFVSSDTVKIILAKGNPHYVCGARVLVKPYREKSKLVERKYYEKLDPSVYYSSHHIDSNPELQARLLRQHQLMEVDERVLENQMRRLRDLKLCQRNLASQSYFGHSMDEMKVSEDLSESELSSLEKMLFSVLNSDPTVDDNNGHSAMNYTDHGSNQGLNLPDSPFAPVVASNVSAVV